MARSYSSAKPISALITNVARRGYAAATQGVSVGAPNVMLKKGSQEPAKISWVPDPVTGYYRPENQAKEVDAAEMLVNNKTRRS